MNVDLENLQRSVQADPAPPSATATNYCFRDAMAQRRRQLEQIRSRYRAEHAAARRQPPDGTRSPLDIIKFDDDPRVFVCTDLLRITGNANEGLLLSQILYWFRSPANHRTDGRQLPRARAMIDGVPWLNRSHKELSRETGLSLSQVKRTLHSLRERLFIETGCFSYKSKTTTHIRLGERMHEFVNEEQIRDTGVTVFAGTVRLAGSSTAALVLSQLFYWFGAGQNGKSRVRVFRDDEYWVAKTYEQLAGEICVSARQARAAVDSLKRRSFVQTASYKFAGTKMLHMRIDADAIANAWIADQQARFSSQEI